MLVAFEGIDGSGKSTLARAVARQLRARGLRVALEREPTPTAAGKAVRQAIAQRADPLLLATLFLADRAAHVPRLARLKRSGRLVLVDRYVDSTSAYQGAALARHWPQALRELDNVQTALFGRPDLVVWLDLPPRVALRRIQGRAVKEFFEKERFLGRVRAGYRALARRRPRQWLRVDARRPADVLAREVATALAARRRPSSAR